MKSVGLKYNNSVWTAVYIILTIEIKQNLSLKTHEDSRILLSYILYIHKEC